LPGQGPPHAARRSGEGPLQSVVLRQRLADAVRRFAVAGDSSSGRHPHGRAGAGGSEHVAEGGGDDGPRAGASPGPVPHHQPADVPASFGVRSAGTVGSAIAAVMTSCDLDDRMTRSSTTIAGTLAHCLAPIM